MGTIDEKTNSRTTKEERNDDPLSRRAGDVGRKSKSYGNQQKRTHRKDCEESRVFSVGTSDAGGMVGQLIGDYQAQLANRKADANRLEEEVKRLEEESKRVKKEIKHLESRIQEFQTFKEELVTPTEENQ